MQPYLYAIAIGSNRSHGHHGRPRQVIDAAVAAMAQAGLVVRMVSPTIFTPALGPAGRSFANAALLVETPLDPPALLLVLQRIENAFGRRRARRWGARVLDLDIALWSQGTWPPNRNAAPDDLFIPHRALAKRDFVLRPLSAIARDWRLGVGQGAVRHAHARLLRRRPIVQAG